MFFIFFKETVGENMLELRFLETRKEEIIESLKKRNFDERGEEMVRELESVDRLRKETQTESDEIKAQFNQLSKEIGQLFKEGKKSEAEVLKEKNLLLKDKIKFLDEKLRNTKSKLNEILFSIPNIVHNSVPPGKGEEDNEVFKSWDQPLPELPASALPHWELAKKYKLIDFEKGAFITGSGFPVYVGKGAQIQRALIAYFLDSARQAGYTEYQLPLMVNEDSARGTGQLPDKEGQMYTVERDGLYLIPTAEVPLTNLYRDEILQEKDLPLKMTGYTPCFRREAGSYGAHVKGLNRLHQFDKVEIVQIRKPEESYQTLEEMVNYVESLVKALGLPYRILRLCGGDIGFTSALTFDFEIYSAAQERWLEVSSVSNFETYQSNRMNLRYRDEEQKTRLAHTLNGSALALPRIFAGILENNQTNDNIVIPEVLRKYTGFDTIV